MGSRKHIANSKQTQLDFAREVISENPHITFHRTLGKLLHKKYPMLFDDIEAARGAIRDVMGKRGLRGSFETTKNQTFLEHLAKLRAESLIEEAELPDVTPYIISERFKRILVIGDTHIPYQDMRSLDLALKYGYNANVDAVVINGDFIDFGTISKFIHKPNTPRVKASIEQGIAILKYIKDALGCKVILHEGNHDIRYEHYIINHAEELFEDKDISLAAKLKVKQLNVDYVKNIRTMHFGKLVICHGNHIVKGIFSPVNPARGAFTKANASIMIGHCHRSSEHIETDIKDKVIGCWSVGALTTTHPEYNPQVSKHNQGFAVVTRIDKVGNYTVDNKKIINYEVR